MIAMTEPRDVVDLNHPSLSLAEFTMIARRAGVEQELWPDLYPMVCDLRQLADQLTRQAPEIHQETPVSEAPVPAMEPER